MTNEEAIRRLKDMYLSYNPFMHGRRTEVEIAMQALETVDRQQADIDRLKERLVKGNKMADEQKLTEMLLQHKTVCFGCDEGVLKVCAACQAKFLANNGAKVESDYNFETGV